jgi:hypothetical protein
MPLGEPSATLRALKNHSVTLKTKTNGKILGWSQKIIAVELLNVDFRGESTL